MKEIEGFICVGRNDKTQVLYGPSSENLEPQAFESLKTNGMIPFNSVELAKLAKEEIIKKMKLKDVEVNRLGLRIAENSDDLFLLGTNGGIIVLMQTDYGWEMIGEYVEGESIYPRPGSFYQRNGLKPFSQLSVAKEAASEIGRQGQTVTTLAQIQLTKVQE